MFWNMRNKEKEKKKKKKKEGGRWEMIEQQNYCKTVQTGAITTH